MFPNRASTRLGDHTENEPRRRNHSQPRLPNGQFALHIVAPPPSTNTLNTVTSLPSMRDIANSTWDTVRGWVPNPAFLHPSENPIHQEAATSPVPTQSSGIYFQDTSSILHSYPHFATGYMPPNTSPPHLDWESRSPSVHPPPTPGPTMMHEPYHIQTYSGINTNAHLVNQQMLPAQHPNFLPFGYPAQIQNAYYPYAYPPYTNTYHHPSLPAQNPYYPVPLPPSAYTTVPTHTTNWTSSLQTHLTAFISMVNKT